MTSAAKLSAIDLHHHFWDQNRGDYPWMVGPVLPIRRVFTPDDMRPLLARAGVQKAILVQTWPSYAESQEFLALAEATDFIAGVVAWVDLEAADVAERLDELLAGPGGGNGWSTSATRCMTKPIRAGCSDRKCAAA